MTVMTGISMEGTTVSGPTTPTTIATAVTSSTITGSDLHT